MPTERGQFVFTVKDGAAPDLFSIAAEPSGQILKSLNGDLICFDLRPGTTEETAREIERYLNHHIAAISLTRFTPRQS